MGWHTSRLKKVRTPGCKDCEKDRRAAVHVTHGGALGGKSKLYQTWQSMRGRCGDLDNPYYGGKGIRVCAEWDDFREFRRWARANGYEPGLSIERNHPDRDYCPANCEWITREENSRRMVAWHRGAST